MGEVLPSDAILLNTLASHSLVRDSSLLSECHTVNEPLLLHTQGGTFQANCRGTCSLFPGHTFSAWYSPKAMGNIITASDLLPQCRIQLDTAQMNAIHVTTPQGQVLSFHPLVKGIYAHKLASSSISIAPSPVLAIQTVAQQKQLFTPRQLQAADKARTLQRVLGHPTDIVLEHALNHGHILNCPITADDVRRANTIYGPSIPILKGHTTNRSLPCPTPPPSCSVVPPDLLKHHNQVTLSIDFFMYKDSHSYTLSLTPCNSDIHCLYLIAQKQP